MIPKNDKVKIFTKQLIINYSDTLQRETIKLICYLSCTGGKRNFTKTGGKRNFFQEINAGGIKQSGYHHFITPDKIMDSENNQQKMLKQLGKGKS